MTAPRAALLVAVFMLSCTTLCSAQTGNLAFFSKKIVLVEGDSELIVLPHIATKLQPHWDFKATSTCLVKISGKGSFRRYREFFDCFKVDVSLIADLDVLVKDFDKLSPSRQAMVLLEDLLKDVDKIVDDENKLAACPPKLLKEELQRDRAKTLYEQLSAARVSGDASEQMRLLDELFVFERTRPRLEILLDQNRASIVNKKRLLLAELRSENIFVLEKGAIEDYYPNGITGPDKPSRAQSFCTVVDTADAIRAQCLPIESGKLTEFELIMTEIFRH